MRMALRIVALFAVYAGLAFVGSRAFGLFAEEPDGASTAVDPASTPAVEGAPSASEQVRSEVLTRLRQRHDDRCDYTLDRELTVPTTGARLVDVRAGSGDLHVEGEDGIDGVVVMGRVCASDEDLVDELQVTAETVGGEILVETHYPDFDSWRGSRTARIDLVVVVPAGFSVDIDDSSGGMDVRRTGALRIDDSSGGITLEDIEGSVEIDDSSGGLDIDGVRGDLRVDDGSGSLEVRSVTGSVEIRDGSGGIEVAEVGADVLIESDGSGGIEVRDVGGDFVVERDGSGGIRYSGVRGRVDIPADKRRGRR